MELTPDERQALQNLARKAGGEEVGWVNIAAARALADKGLAERDRQGWHINSQGTAWLQTSPAPPVETVSAPPQALHPRDPIS